ncbi:TRAP transporter substrate-binding protein [Tuberibacillus sp. Marseille-P3662]|uniref:TRAP transporter substrate-binding protein n=1 Tax=Tuberibacillus sp. Marseille-P3662 TaxID=1965358 RepID=UPI000A1C7F63|nr:TRAP transporter substrate-binding protein [Tuberibacillus sp. Marseille-P3662]
MKKLSIFGLLILLAMSLIACSQSSSKASNSKNNGKEQMVLKLAENQPEDYPTTLGAKEFARLVKEKTDGRIKIKVYAGGQLGDEKSVIEQVQLGTIDLARVNATPLTEFSDSIGVLSMPFLFRSEEHKWKVFNGDIGQELLNSLKSSNMIGLAYYDSGARSFYNSQHPVKKPEDLKGLKIRVQQSEMAIDMVEALGASATPMAFEEVYSGIQTGVIDGAENNIPSYFTTGHYEVAKYYTINKHSSVPEIVIASSKLWDKLSDKDQQLIQEAAKESVKLQRKEWKKLVEASLKKIKANGNEMIKIDDTSAWREAVQSVYDKYGDQFGDMIEKIENVK